MLHFLYKKERKKKKRLAKMMKDLPIHPGVVRNIRLAFITRDNSAALLKALERCRQQGIK